MYFLLGLMIIDGVFIYFFKLESKVNEYQQGTRLTRKNFWKQSLLMKK